MEWEGYILSYMEWEGHTQLHGVDEAQGLSAEVSTDFKEQLCGWSVRYSLQLSGRSVRYSL